MPRVGTRGDDVKPAEDRTFSDENVEQQGSSLPQVGSLTAQSGRSTAA
jgi:hypothetical protein